MKRVMKKEDLAAELASRCDFYKKNMMLVVEELSEIIIENMAMAKFNEPSEIQLAPGIIIGGKRIPERESVDPRDGSTIIAVERVRPYVTFKDSVKRKLKEQPKKKRRK